MPDAMAGRVCVVTGASSGIGKATATALASLGATVVLVCRDHGRGAAAMAEIGAAATGAEPSLELADLASMRQVRDLATRLGTLPRLDVLVNNAGLRVGRRQLTADGLEHTLAVNHLAPFLLTNLLRPALEASAPARVVTVASVAHRIATLHLDDLQLERRYAAMLAYSNSKLANVLFTRELARRLEGTGVTANCAHPGMVATNFLQSENRLLQLGMTAGRHLVRSPQSGARTIVYLASSPDVASQTGGYYVSRRRRRPSRTARDDHTAGRLWDISTQLTGLTLGARPRPAGMSSV
ncbi:MAG TPA: SDR family oxidoreductase [Streptosporangiaceae bacterium]